MDSKHYQEVDKKASTLAGYLFYLTFLTTNLICVIIIKIVFQLSPTIDPFELILIRSGYQIIFLLCYMHRHTKYYMYDQIQKRHAGFLCLRTFSHATTVFANIYVLGIISLTLIAVVKNLQPLLSSFLAFLILNETINAVQVVCLVLAFSGVLFLTLHNATSKDDGSSTPDESDSTLSESFAYLVLFSLPFVTSTTNLITRYIRDLSTLSLTVFGPFLQFLICFIGIIFCNPDGLKFLKGLPLSVYLFLLVESLCSLIATLSKASSLKNSAISSVLIMQYLQIVLMMMADFFIFKIKFSLVDICGCVGVLVPCILSSYWKLKLEEEENKRKQQKNIEDPLLQ